MTQYNDREPERRARNAYFFYLVEAGNSRIRAWFWASRAVGYPWWRN